MPHASAAELTKVDILNCMGVGMAVLAVGAVFRGDARTRFAVGAGLAIAAASPVMANLPWSGVPALLQEYLVPGSGRGRFPFFPNVAYIAFGQAIGAIVKRAAADRFDRLMQWSTLIGFGMIFIGQYFSNIPYSIYTKVNFWTDSPALIVIRVGICLMLMAGAYLWTEYCAGTGWSWMQAMGKNSLMVYWVHVMIVYGSLVQPIKRTFSIPQAALATVIVTLMMVAMSALWLAWKGRKAAKRRRWRPDAPRIAGIAILAILPGLALAQRVVDPNAPWKLEKPGMSLSQEFGIVPLAPGPPDQARRVCAARGIGLDAGRQPVPLQREQPLLQSGRHSVRAAGRRRRDAG